jgi:hypothetical protein
VRHLRVLKNHRRWRCTKKTYRSAESRSARKGNFQRHREPHGQRHDTEGEHGRTETLSGYSHEKNQRALGEGGATGEIKNPREGTWRLFPALEPEPNGKLCHTTPQKDAPASSRDRVLPRTGAATATHFDHIQTSTVTPGLSERAPH